jgi:uncharacterized protein
MGILHQVSEYVKAASAAQARWDYEVSTNIVKSRKKLLILLLLLLPILAVSVSDAGAILGGKSAYAPSFYSTSIFVVSIAIGVIAGLITGCIGAGGGFIIAPALMAAGVKGILAVGTDVFHLFAKAIMGTTVHKKLGNVSFKLAMAFLAGSAGGTFLGGSINKGLYNKDPLISDLFINTVYAVLLGFFGFFALYDYIKSRKNVSAGSHGAPAGTTKLALNMQNINIPPMITFDEEQTLGGRRIAGLFVAIGGFFVGTVAAIMGVGGGFITFPMFVYVFGVSTATTVGTDILQIIFTAGLASIAQYAIYGYVFYTLAMGMLIGSLIGVQVGALTTKVVKGIQIRAFFAITVIAGFISRVTTLPKKLVDLDYLSISKDMVTNIELAGNVLFWIVVAVFGVWVFSKFFANLKTLKGEA